MALVDASSMFELKAFGLRFRIYKPDGVVFKLGSITKKRTPGLFSKILFFGAFPNNKHPCVFENLKCYEEWTQGF